MSDDFYSELGITSTKKVERIPSVGDYLSGFGTLTPDEHNRFVETYKSKYSEEFARRAAGPEPSRNKDAWRERYQAAQDEFNEAVSKAAPKKEVDTVADSAANLARAFGAGAAGAARSTLNVFGGGETDAAKFFGRTAESWQKAQTPTEKILAQRDAQEKQRAAEVGVGQDIWTQATNIRGTDISSGAGSLLVSAVGGGAGAGARLGLRALGAARAAAVAPKATAAILGAAQGVGGLRTNRYDAVKQNALRQGYSEAEAEQYAIDAMKLSAGETLGAAALGAADSLIAAEAAFIPNTSIKISPGTSRFAVPKTVGGAILKETGQEAGQTGAEEYLTNEALINYGLAAPGTEMKGVAGKAAAAGIIGGILGSATGTYQAYTDKTIRIGDIAKDLDETKGLAPARVKQISKIVEQYANKQGLDKLAEMDGATGDTGLAAKIAKKMLGKDAQPEAEVDPEFTPTPEQEELLKKAAAFDEAEQTDNQSNVTASQPTGDVADGAKPAQFGTYIPSETGSQPNTEAPLRLAQILDRETGNAPITVAAAESLAREHEKGYSQWAEQDTSPNAVRREPEGFIKGTVDNILATAYMQGMDMDPAAEARGKARAEQFEAERANLEGSSRYDLGDRTKPDGTLATETEFQQRADKANLIPTRAQDAATIADTNVEDRQEQKAQAAEEVTPNEIAQEDGIAAMDSMVGGIVEYNGYAGTLTKTNNGYYVAGQLVEAGESGQTPAQLGVTPVSGARAKAVQAGQAMDAQAKLAPMQPVQAPTDLDQQAADLVAEMENLFGVDATNAMIDAALKQLGSGKNFKQQIEAIRNEFNRQLEAATTPSGQQASGTDRASGAGQVQATAGENGADAGRAAEEGKVKAPVLQNRNRANPSSIAQMQSIAKGPDYGRLGFSRDFANGAPVVAGGEIASERLGKKDIAVASDGRKIPIQYAVIEASVVLPSNKADGTPFPTYATATNRTRAIAGNGRVAGMQAAYRRGTASQYASDLANDDLHGIDPEVIRSMNDPMLVRVMPVNLITDDIGDVSNTQGNLSLSPVEQANNDANRIDLDALQFSDSGSITPETVRQFVRAMPQAEQGELLDINGQPTKQAVDRLNAAIFAKAYNNDALVRLYAQAQDPEAQMVLSALAQAAPKMARLEGAGPLDIRDIVTQAAEIAVNARRDGKELNLVAKQVDMAADPDVGVVLKLFADNTRTVKPVVESLGRAADFAYAESNKPDNDMFGAVPKAERQDVLKEIGEKDGQDEKPVENKTGRKPIEQDANRKATDSDGQKTPASNKAKPAKQKAEGLTSPAATEAAPEKKLPTAPAVRKQIAKREAEAKRDEAELEKSKVDVNSPENKGMWKIVGYDERTKLENYIDGRGEERTRKIVDWDKSETSSGSGRKIGYLFELEHKETGERRIFGRETAHIAMGVTPEVALQKAQKLNEEKARVESFDKAMAKGAFDSLGEARAAAKPGEVTYQKNGVFANMPDRPAPVRQAVANGWTEAEALTSPTPADILAQEAAKEKAAADKKAADAKADREEAKARERKEIAQRSEAAADTFELGQNAEDNLSGQKGMFSRAKPQTIEVDGIDLPLNEDGTVTLYHHTSKQNADSIRQSGILRSQAEPDVYMTTRREADTGYGDTAVALRVNPEKLSLDDEFPDGRADFRLSVGKPGGSIRVKVDKPDVNQAFSQGTAQKTGNTVAKVNATLKSEGLDKNNIKVVQSQDQVGPGLESVDINGVQGFYNPANGEVTLVADNIPQGKEAGVALHEIFHRAEEAALTAQQRAELTSQVKRWRLRDPKTNERKIFDAATKRAKESGDESGEFLAYAAEEAKNLGIQPNAKKGTISAEGWLAKVKKYFTAALEKLAPTYKGELNADDLVDIAYGIAARDAEMQAQGKPLPKTIEVDGKQRPTTNSNGQPIHPTVEGVRNFWRWFGDSKVVDEQGRPMVMYHGTDKKFNEFKPQKGLRGNTAKQQFWEVELPIYYFTPDENYAKTYGDAKNSVENYVMPVYLRAKWMAKLRDFSDIEEYTTDTEEQFEQQEKGFWQYIEDAKFREKLLEDWDDGTSNTVVVFEEYEGMEYVVFSPEQIKSATGNIGTFDPTNPDIRYSRQPLNIKQMEDAIKSKKLPDEPRMTLQQFDDMMATNLTDSTRPHDVWARTQDPDLAAELVRQKNLATGRIGDFEKQAMLKFGQAISNDIGAIANKAGISWEMAKQLAGDWMSAVYAPIANKNLMRQDQEEFAKAIDEVTELSDEVNYYNQLAKDVGKEIASGTPTTKVLDSLLVRSRDVSRADRRLKKMKERETATPEEEVEKQTQIAYLENLLDEAEADFKELRAEIASGRGNDAIARNILKKASARATALRIEMNKKVSEMNKARDKMLKRAAAVAGPATDPTETRLEAGVAGGYTDKLAEKVRGLTESVISKSDLEKLAEKVYAMNAWKLDQDLKSGKVTQKMVDSWPKSKYYVPLTGDPRSDQGEGTDLFGTGDLNQGSDKKMEGRTQSRAQDGITASFEQLDKSAKYYGWAPYKDALHTWYEKTFNDFVAQGLPTVDEQKARAEMRKDGKSQKEIDARIKVMERKYAADQIREMYGISRSREAMQRPSDNVIIYRKGGKNWAYDIGNQEAVAALKASYVEPLTGASRIVGGVTRFLARNVVQFLPGQAINSFVRDVWEKSENIRTRSLELGFDMNQVGRDLIKKSADPRTAKAIAQVVAQGSSLGGAIKINENDPIVKQVKEFLATGGGSTWGESVSAGVDQLNQMMMEQLTLANSQGGWGMTKTAALKTAQVFEVWNQTFELKTAFASYQALVENGVPKETAAEIALELMNYRKRGKRMRNANAFYMFAQTIATGGQQMYKTLRTPRGRKRVQAQAAISFALYSLIRSLYEDDETGENMLDNYSDSALERIIPIPLPWSSDGVFKLPVGFGTPQLSWGIGMNLARATQGNQTALETIGNITKLFAKSMVPVAPSEASITNDPFTWMLQTFSPSVSDPILNIGMNKTAFGGNLASVNQRDKPEALQGKRNTAEEYKAAAEWAAKNLGADLAPEKWRELGWSYLAGPLKEFVIKPLIDNPNKEKMAQIMADAGGKPATVYSTMIDRWFTSINDDTIKQRLFYKARDEMIEVNEKKELGRELSQRDEKLIRLYEKVKREEGRARQIVSQAAKSKSASQKERARVDFAKAMIKIERDTLKEMKSIKGLD